jgi:hypothetical protein
VTSFETLEPNYYDRFHFVIEDKYGNILARDVIAQEARVTRLLSGPSEIEFKIHPKDPSIQQPGGIGPIQLKPWGHWCHAMKMGLDGQEKIWASGLFQPSDIDPVTGVMTARFQGFSGYAKGLPWLENWNPIAVDPFEIVQRIWTHIQSFPHGDLGVTVYPNSSGTQMLPGFSFNGEEFVQDFFAIFIREADRLDCGDYINKLARDIPFDYWEESEWNETKTAITKKIRLAYPAGGVDQEDLVFRAGENIVGVRPKQETEVEWFSDITIKGFFPGKVYSHTLANADPDRYRRVMDETDLNIDSNERAKAWAKRKLSRRQFPNQFDSIIIDPYHPNAPFDSFDVGDIIRIVGPVHWVGDIDVKHKIIGHTWDEKSGQVELRVMAEGAFNYDPIEYVAP